jgi:tRNA(His) 5'-end guanylyltransferase
MKCYEKVENKTLTRRTPVIVRVDGKAFHTMTRLCADPFDASLCRAMDSAAQKVMKQMQNCRLVYTQSDEASFLLMDTATLTTEPWLGNRVQRITSVSASAMTIFFHEFAELHRVPIGFGAMFDARCFNLPTEEIANYFLWRARDWSRNSLQMLARSEFSHKELHGKGQAEMHEMLHGRGINWAKLPGRFRNGRFTLADGGSEVEARSSYEDVSDVVGRAMEGE